MPINFPASLDSFANPTSGSYEDDVGLEHHTQHANANDAAEALEAKVGIGAGAPAANTVLRGTGAGASGWGQVGTLDIAAGAVIGAWSVSGTPANYSGTPQNTISGSSLSITMAGANPLLLGVSLMSVINTTATATLTVQVWEGAGAIATVGNLTIDTSRYLGIAKTFFIAPTAGAHTYFLAWSVQAGTVTAGEFSFWAMEIRR